MHDLYHVVVGNIIKIRLLVINNVIDETQKLYVTFFRKKYKTNWKNYTHTHTHKTKKKSRLKGKAQFKRKILAPIGLL